MGLSLLYLVTVKRRLCQMNQPNNYADKNICLKSPTAWGTVPPNVGFHSPRQGEIFQSCIFHLKRSSNGLEFNRLYTSSPSAVSIYFWRGWRGELGYFIVTRPFWRAGVREYSRKLGRFSNRLPPLFPLRSFHLCQSQWLTALYFSDNADTVSSKLVWVLVWVSSTSL